MAFLQNDLLLKALARQPVPRTPVWLMRQAGRYLPEYRALREKAKSFQALYQNPDWACEVTLQPLARFELDAAIIFKDILTIPEAMGLPLEFREGEGPVFLEPIRSKEAIQELIIPEPEEQMPFVLEAIRQVKNVLNGRVPLIGFSGSPWTLAAYMIEGRGGQSFSEAKKFLYRRPDLLSALIDKLTISVQKYLQGQIKAGCDVLMIFDTWGGLLSTPDFNRYSLKPITALLKQLPSHIPVILFVKQGASWLPQLAEAGCSALGLDWTTTLSWAYHQVGHRVALQGNLDPQALWAPLPDLEYRITALLEDYGNQPGHIFNLGHGMLPDLPIEAVHCLIETVRRVSTRIRSG